MQSERTWIFSSGIKNVQQFRWFPKETQQFWALPKKTLNNFWGDVSNAEHMEMIM